MNISIIKELNDIFYLKIENLSQDIYKYKIRKSWDSSFEDEVLTNHLKLYEENVLIYEKQINLVLIKLPLDKINSINEFYFIDIVFKDNNVQTIYIDYNTFFNIKSKDKIYVHEFNYDTLVSKRNSLYKFYLKGNYGDIHQATLLCRINSEKALLKVPDIDFKSEVYNIIVEKNNSKIYEEPFSIITREKLQFSFQEYNFGEFKKIKISPKYKYPTLNKINIFYKNKLMFSGLRNEIEFFIPKYDCKNENNVIVEYYQTESLIQENFITNSNQYNLFYLNDSIDNITYNYDYLKDSLILNIQTNFNFNYKIKINNNEYFFNSNKIIINNFSKYNNNSDFININVYYSSNFEYNYLYSFSIENYMKINKINKFIPVIDYSDCLDVHKHTGRLNWTVPSVGYYSKIKVNVLNVKQFLDEYISIWNKDYILDKTVIDFDEKYLDYNEELQYDFSRDGINMLKSPNESLICYDSLNNGFIEIGQTNNHNINLWYCEKGYKYSITIELYDLWLNKIGENNVEFSLYDNYVGEVKDEWLWFDRNQTIQFGETGTIGEFYKISNPTPYDCMYSYSPEYKTYNGKALYNQSNIDSNNNSLYFYLNSENDIFRIKYKRTYNFYEFEYSLINSENDIILKAIHEPKGNDYEDNIIDINKELFKEGKNKLQIRTFNSEGISSNIKEYNFTLFNNKPEIPQLKINNNDFYINQEGNLIINKKYFQFIITNNGQSKIYAGWNYKEVHFYFKLQENTYNEYPDYVVLASKDDGSIVLNNSVEIENGNYDCKIIAYDYNGNSSDSYEFSFKLISEIKIEPETLYTNKTELPFKWKILKSQDSEGFYYFFKHSTDGINFVETEHTKIISPYYINDKNTAQEYTLSINWIYKNMSYQDGIYKLVVYEHNLKHPEGLSNYQFESPEVEVSRVSDPSNPIYAEETSNNKVINKKEYNEYSYTNDINSIVFETIHSVEVFDNPETSEIEGQRYKIDLISPDNNIYSSDLPLPTEIGIYKFDRILDKCNVTNPIEGVWELRFITIDKYGNSNAHKGYYTYYIVYLNRNPKITILNPNTSNGSNIFGINSESISYIVNTSEIYSDILNFELHKEKFKINKFKMIINYNPFGSSYEVNLTSDNNILEILNKLTNDDKLNHLRDGKYSISIYCLDNLERKSSYVDRIFYIDTQLNGELLFVNNNVFNNRIIDLIAVASGEVFYVYYTLDLENDDISTWEKIQVQNIQYNNEILYGIIISDLSFDTDGKKILKYVLEEESGNISDPRYYYFNIDTDIKLYPIFDYSNKIYYTIEDKNLYFSWNQTNDDVNHFYYKLDKINDLGNGEIEIVESYMPSVNGTLLPVGPSKNDFTDLGDSREIYIPISNNNWLISGYYLFTLKGFNVYEESNINTFRINIDLETPIDANYEITNNKITLNNNVISWNHITEANYYEVSYDGLNWVKVIDNSFAINTDKVIKDNNDKTYIYMRWRSYTGIYSSVSKIEVLLNITKLKNPTVKYYENISITENNKKIEWVVNIEDIPNAKYLYYSFDNENWQFKKIQNSIEKIIDDSVEYPVKDGRYNIYLRTTDSHPIDEKYLNKSDIVYSYIDIFSDNIEKPIFTGIQNGNTFNLPVRLIISNKMNNVTYYIFVNGLLVQEGYEIESYFLQKYNIEVKAKKNGIEKIYNILTSDDNFHIYSKTNEKYTISIADQKAICYVDSDNSELIINSMPGKRNIEVILYREKNSNQKWNILKIGDRLSLNNEWEFKISTFEII